MRETILNLKQECKTLAQEIKTLKSKRKELKGYVPGLSGNQQDFRIKHIAYCLLRGRTMEQIENKLRDPNDYNHTWVREKAQKIVDAAKAKEAAKEVVSEQAVCINP